jgi:hypothetical protein
MSKKFSIEVKQHLYCYVIFYGVYINGSLYHNYTTLSGAKRAIARLTDES